MKSSISNESHLNVNREHPGACVETLVEAQSHETSAT